MMGDAVRLDGRMTHQASPGSGTGAVTMATLVTALEVIYGEASGHPLYMGDGATDEEIIATGGDAATITSIGAGLRIVIDRIREGGVEPQDVRG